ncbi:MAG: hypothetical protein K6T30_04705, partial [Alicyclobacillus sp.]|nr:hypothetical protein [Alicyclobacillus sp.]
LSEWGLSAPGQADSPSPAELYAGRWEELYEALQEPVGAGVLAEALGWTLDKVYAGLLELELAGWVERQPGGLYRRRTGTGVAGSTGGLQSNSFR